MKLFLRNLRIVLAVFLLISVTLVGGLFVQQYRSANTLLGSGAENKYAMRERYKNAGKIVSRDGVILAQSLDGDRIYAEDDTVARSFVQLVGDYTHHISNTIENRYQGTLLGHDRNVLKQMIMDFSGKGLKGDDIYLSLDAGLNARALKLLGDRRGAIVVINYQTGELLASVSSPSLSPEQLVNYEDIPDTALFNRALQSDYFPGSTFKTVTSTAWLESPAYNPDLQVTCGYPNPLLPGGAQENYGSGHGTNGLSGAFQTSCNYFFGTVGIEIGAEALQKKAEQFGFNKELSLDKLYVSTPAIRIPEHDDPLLSWVALGQPAGESVLTAPPLFLAMVAGSVANNGTMVEPQVVQYKVDAGGKAYDKIKVESLGQSMRADTAAALQGIMEDNVRAQYPSGVYSDYAVGAKSGTAERAGQEHNDRLAIAYMRNDAKPYACAIVLENSSAAATDLLPDLFEAILNITS